MNMDTEKIQNKILEIVRYFDELCNNNGITYYLMGGSALGAIRHKGFIPWDDDFDVFMTYDNYIRFIRICENSLDNKRFYLQLENTEEWPLFFTKLRLNNTTYIEEDTINRKMHKGFYIDIMCLNNTSSNILFRYLQYLSARIITTKTLAIRGYRTNSKVKKVFMLIVNLIVSRTMTDVLVKFVRILNKKETKYVAHFFGRARFKNISFPKHYLGKPRYVEFSELILPVPEKVENYLSVRFGDKYMDIPDKKTREQYPNHAIYVDTENDFSNYT